MTRHATRTIHSYLEPFINRNFVTYYDSHNVAYIFYFLTHVFCSLHLIDDWREKLRVERETGHVGSEEMCRLSR